jgi:hypothetical protein
MEVQEIIPYIKLSRKAFKNFLWKERRPYSRFEAWLDLIRRASFSEETTDLINGKVITRNKGQVVGSIRFFMEAWSWGKSKVCDFLELLRSQEMISIDRVNGISVVSLLNYDKYNGAKTTKGQQIRQVNDGLIDDYEDEGDSEQLEKGTTGGQPGDSEGTNIIKDKKGKSNKRPIGITAASLAASAITQTLRLEYDQLVASIEGKENIECWLAVKAFIGEKKPGFIEPYIDAWNIFAITHNLIIKPIKVTAYRQKKFETRMREPDFDFLAILQVVKKSKFLRGQNDRGWKVSFEYIIDSEEKYTKILEEKYE